MLGVSQHTDPKLFGCEIIFEEFQRIWTGYLNVTDGRTDRRLTVASPRSALASRGNKMHRIIDRQTDRLQYDANSAKLAVCNQDTRWEQIIHRCKLLAQWLVCILLLLLLLLLNSWHCHWLAGRLFQDQNKNKCNQTIQYKCSASHKHLWQHLTPVPIAVTPTWRSSAARLGLPRT